MEIRSLSGQMTAWMVKERIERELCTSLTEETRQQKCSTLYACITKDDGTCQRIR
jgi:hypothetical protein